MDIVFESHAFRCIPHPSVHKALLPDPVADAKELTCFIREAAFNILHDALQSHAFGYRDQQMDVVAHHDKGMNEELTDFAVVEQRRAEQISHSVGLQNMSFVEGSGGDEVCGTRGLASVL